MTNLVQIPKDVFVQEILDKLSVQDLMHILTTNKELEKYLEVFAEKFADHQEDLRHRREIAGPKYIRNVEYNQEFLRQIKGPKANIAPFGTLALDDQLAQSMDLEYSELPRMRGKILYFRSGLIRWWQIYVRDNNAGRLKPLEDAP